MEEPHVRFGSKADICGATSHVRFTPDSDRESEFLRKVMSTLPPKADISQRYSISSSMGRSIASSPSRARCSMPGSSLALKALL